MSISLAKAGLAGACLLIALGALTTTALGNLMINANYVNSAGQTWDATRIAVFDQAITDWTSVISGVDDGGGGAMSVSVNVTVDFTQAGTGGYLGQWQGSYSAYEGDSVRPWSSGVTHAIHFNADLFSGANALWFDPTPSDDGTDKPFSDWDAVSVARHEIGHMLGFTSLYVDNAFTGSETSPWTSQISADVFDPGGLNVAMEPGDPGHVLDDSLLMDTSLGNDEYRIGISTVEQQMLSHAYGYVLTAVPEPHTMALTAFGILAAFRFSFRRRRASRGT